MGIFPKTESISIYEVQRSVSEQMVHAAFFVEDSSSPVKSFPVTFTSPCAEVDILRWMKGAKVHPRLYWSSRNGDLEVGGLGATQVIRGENHTQISRAFEQMEQSLSAQPDNTFIRFLGGTRFAQQTTVDNSWTAFPSVWFVLPQLMITRNRAECFATATALWDIDTDATDLKMRLLESLDLFFRDEEPDAGGDAPHLVSRRDTPDHSAWTLNVRDALAKIASGALDKIVLARRSDLTLSAAIDPFDYLRALKAIGNDCYTFLFEPVPGTAFAGASPEQLFRLTGNRLDTEAVAGTVARGKTAEEENHYSTQLLGSSKDLSEQRYVVEAINRRLQQLCSSLTMSERPAILKLANVQHLITRFSGTVRPSTSIADIFTTMHPTPAVSGTPLQTALQSLARYEGFDRGWYASGVGAVSFHATEMAVAIRSALIRDNRVSCFTGAGIVKGSDPEAEWEELEHKMAPALAILSGVRD
jgi:menaquinone-specific isochorismate synthase